MSRWSAPRLRVFVSAITAMAGLLVAACGSGGEAGRASGGSLSGGVPTREAASQEAMELGPVAGLDDLPIRTVEGYVVPVESLGDLRERVDAVFVGMYLRVEPDVYRLPPVAEDPDSGELVFKGFVFEVRTVLSGDPPAEVVLMEPAHEVDAEGRPFVRYAHDVYPLADRDVGQDFLVFASRSKRRGAEHLYSAFPFHGLSPIVDGRVVAYRHEGVASGPILEYEGSELDEVVRGLQLLGQG